MTVKEGGGKDCGFGVQGIRFISGAEYIRWFPRFFLGLAIRSGQKGLFGFELIGVRGIKNQRGRGRDCFVCPPLCFCFSGEPEYDTYILRRF